MQQQSGRAGGRLKKGVDLESVELIADEPLADDRDGVRARIRIRQDNDGPWPFRSGTRQRSRREAETLLVPYHSWAERGPGLGVGSVAGWGRRSEFGRQHIL